MKCIVNNKINKTKYANNKLTRTKMYFLFTSKMYSVLPRIDFYDILILSV